MRVFGDTGFSQPLIILTSGYEEESLFAIWKFINGQDVYADPHNIPYAASYFNWLFYYSYGSVIKILQSIFGFSDEWIPQVGRYISLCGALWCAFISWKTIKLFCGKNALPVFVISVLISYFFGYFVAFWLFTVRPDIWATALILTGLHLFFRYLNNQKLWLLISSALVFYLAWSFKHNYAGLAMGCFAVLVIRKQYARAIIFALIPVCLVLATYFLSSDAYKYLLIESQLGQGLDLGVGIHNLKMAIIKSLNISATAFIFIVIIIAAYGLKKVSKKILASDIALTLFCCGVVSFPLFLLASFKAGAADNYFFSPFSICLYIVVYVVYTIGESNHKNKLYATYGMLSILYIGLGVLIITGKQGVLNHKELSEKYYEIKDVVEDSRQPVYVYNDNNANLPWLNPSEEHFIIATTYFLLRTEPDKLEEGGIEGLMNKGYFNTIINVNSVNHNNMDKYYLADTITKEHATMYVWQKR